MTEQKRPQQCEGCALAEHDAYICARWRLSYAVNELNNDELEITYPEEQ